MLELNQKLSRFCAAFSLVEILVALVIVSLITAALAPVITKKLSSSAITIVGGGGNSGIIETSTAPQSQKDCNTVGAQLVYVETNAEQKTGLCVTQYNIGDGNFSIPTGSIDENIEAGTSKPDGYCNTKKCCWHGSTANPSYCNSNNGGYSGCNRILCNWEAANSICDNLSYGGYSNWRLPTKDELEKLSPDITTINKGTNGLMFCTSAVNSNNDLSLTPCCGIAYCQGAYNNHCSPHDIWDSEHSSKFFEGNFTWTNRSYDKVPASTRCVLGAITVKTVSDTACSNGSFLNEDSACVSCTIHSPKCTSCTKDFCSACADGWKVSATGGCEDPNKKSCTITFGEAGDKQFTIPSDVDSMEVILVSGGNGGNGGNGTLMTHTFVTTGTGNSANDDDNLLTVESTGIIDYTIPNEIKDKNVLITACGGGGGGGGKWTHAHAGGGGSGGYLTNTSVKLPADKIKIFIGGGGGAGGGDNHVTVCLEGLPYGGGGGGNEGSVQCKGSSPGGNGGYKTSGIVAATGGSTGGGSGRVANHGACSTLLGGAGNVGGNGGTALCEEDGGHAAGAGGGTEGGGGGAASSTAGAGGGGGGGGSAAHYSAGTASGGGGGGNFGGQGGGYQHPGGFGGHNGADGSGYIAGTISTIFSNKYCHGGNGATSSNGRGTVGNSGAMRITYVGAGTTSIGGLGGGSGAIVPMQTVDLINNDYISAGEVLKIHVGKGGIGSAGAHIKDDGTIITSGSAGTQGEETYISNNSNVKILATKGMQTGENAGYITNGKNSTQIVVDGFLNSNGSNNTGKFGGNGGTIILETRELVGGLGATTEADGASALIGNYGTGGGGGYGAMAGGNGADGYAKIKFMTSSANCTAAKAEIAYNDFIENKNNLFMKIKLAITNIKDFIVALFKPQIRCKTCMK